MAALPSGLSPCLLASLQCLQHTIPHHHDQPQSQWHHCGPRVDSSDSATAGNNVSNPCTHGYTHPATACTLTERSHHPSHKKTCVYHHPATLAHAAQSHAVHNHSAITQLHALSLCQVVPSTTVINPMAGCITNSTASTAGLWIWAKWAPWQHHHHHQQCGAGKRPAAVTA